jgi:hypothetical protein
MSYVASKVIAAFHGVLKLFNEFREPVSVIARRRGKNAREHLVYLSR